MATMMLATFTTTLVSILLVSVSLLLIGLVLIQKNRGSGLSGAFGGVGGHTAFGTKTGDFLTWITVGFTALFLLLSIIGVFVFEPEKPMARQSSTVQPADESGAISLEETFPIDAAEGVQPVKIDLTPLSAPPEGLNEPAPAPSSDENP